MGRVYPQQVHRQLRVVAETPQGCDAIQRDLERLKNWAEKILTKFNKGKHPVEQAFPLWGICLLGWMAARASP